MPRNARAWLGRVEQENDEYAPEDFGEIENGDELTVGQLALGNGMQIAIVRPRNFQDAATIGDYYREEIPVIINLEDMGNAEAGRIIDFVSGLVLGLCGDIERVSRRTFLIVPGDATMITSHGRSTRAGFFNQA